MATVRLMSKNDDLGGVLVIDLDRADTEPEYVKIVAQRLRSMDNLVALKSTIQNFEAFPSAIYPADDHVQVHHVYVDIANNILVQHAHQFFDNGTHFTIVYEYNMVLNNTYTKELN